MAQKAKTVYVCSECGFVSPKWNGQCPECGNWNTFVEEIQTPSIGTAKRNDAGNCSLTWVMPYLKSDYTHNRENYDSYYDSVEVCDESAKAHPKSAIQIRNRAIVDRSDLCVFYVCKKQGGAYQTMKYAAKQGKDTVNLYYDSFV